MDDRKKLRAYVKTAKTVSSGRKISVRIALGGPAGEALIRLTCTEEAMSWDSAL